MKQPQSPVLSRIVVLVGLMGAGKTTVGRSLAKELGVRFRDSDDEIAKAAGCSIPDIFELHGEAIFRDLEQRVLIRLLEQKKPYILATGGGAFMNAGVREAIRELGVAVWLKADLDVLLERVSRRGTRPLLETGDKRAILERLMEERYPVYAEAEITINSAAGAREKVMEDIIRVLRQKGYVT